MNFLIKIGVMLPVGGKHIVGHKSVFFYGHWVSLSHELNV